LGVKVIVQQGQTTGSVSSYFRKEGFRSNPPFLPFSDLNSICDLVSTATFKVQKNR